MELLSTPIILSKLLEPIVNSRSCPSAGRHVSKRSQKLREREKAKDTHKKIKQSKTKREEKETGDVPQGL